MGRAIVRNTKDEGEVFNKWLYSRLIEHNKNVLGAELGATGSGKSYRDLRKAELWYKFYFKKDFPTEHICFGVGQAMKLLASGKLLKGDIIIFEEAGVNLGSLDFQNKISKMMTYVLQSFRSMNVAIFFNLPYLSMLNAQARKLLHYSFESCGINAETQENKCKPKFHQVNQDTGKIYKKYPIVKVGGRTRKIKRFTFKMPSQYLIDAYEGKKAGYLKELTKRLNEEVEKLEFNNKPEEYAPRKKDLDVYRLHTKGFNHREIYEQTGIPQSTISRLIIKVEKWVKLRENSKGIEVLPNQNVVAQAT